MLQNLITAGNSTNKNNKQFIVVGLTSASYSSGIQNIKHSATYSLGYKISNIQRVILWEYKVSNIQRYFFPPVQKRNNPTIHYSK